ncbi:MAG: AIPR family protein [Sulfurovum sp.]|nr:AIPR family protein [Sulfurovum sp.]
MKNKIEQFREDFLQNIFAEAEANENFFESVFVEYFAKELEESGEIDDEVQLSHWSQRGIKVDGYSYNEDDGILNLFISVFSENFDEKSLTQTEVNQAFNRVKNFFVQAFEKNYYAELEEATSVYDLAYSIRQNKNNISKVKYYLLSNKILSDRVEAIKAYENDQIVFSFHIWDISRLFRMDISNQKKEDIQIVFDEISPEPLYCLPAHLNTDEYQSYLLVMPGAILASLYGRYEARLLEQNVRTFLQARGKVNKGLRYTIINQPEKFFAYNNGLTTTAEAIETEQTEKGLRLKSLKNMQIVNGGQTTASIYSALRKDRANLDNIFVQMKLTIVDPQEAQDLVPKISEYANTQNKVNAADFFSTHPFHIRMEDFSRRIFAPAFDGEHRQMKWFYERARGQYQDAQAHKTKAERNRFQLEYPKTQVITKTDLSKYENVWEEIPHIVARGAQYSFVEYARDIGKRWEKSDTNFNELYFKTAVAKAIIFKTVEKIISNSYWYDGGYRAQTVAYTVAYIDYIVKKENKYFDFMAVWNKQAVSDATEALLKLVSKAVYDEMTNPPSGIANISQWAKKEGCWQSIQSNLSIEVPDLFLEELIGEDNLKEEKKNAKKIQRIDNGIEAQKRVFEIAKINKWEYIKNFGIKNNELTAKDISLLDIAIAIPQKIPTERQSIAIMEAVFKLENIGLLL